MKVTTGKITGESVLLDHKVSLPGQKRVRVILESIGPTFDANTTPEISREEQDIANAARERLGKITKQECE